MGTHGLHPVFKGVKLAEQRFHCERSDDICQLRGVQCVVEGMRADGGHGLRPVDEGKAFFGFERKAGKAGQLHGAAAGIFSPL